MEKTIKGVLKWTPYGWAVWDKDDCKGYKIDGKLVQSLGNREEVNEQQIELTIKTVDKKEEAKNGE